jgi:predicted DNA-binding protein (MmcQ/YjbR family)
MTGTAKGGRSKNAPAPAASKRAPKAAPKATSRRAKAEAAPKAKAATSSRAKPKTVRPAPSSQGSDASTSGPTFEKIRALCLALPDTKLTMTWGSPHFRVGEKIFCGFGSEGGKEVMGVKLGPSHARSIIKDARFWPAPYVGKHGWVSMNVSLRKSWSEVEALIRESYELIAPKAALKKLR